MSTPHGGTYDLNVGRLIDDYPDFYIRGGFEGVGWQAQRRSAGLPRGKAVTAMSLDELAAKMDAMREGQPSQPGRPGLHVAR